MQTFNTILRKIGTNLFNIVTAKVSSLGLTLIDLNDKTKCKNRKVFVSNFTSQKLLILHCFIALEILNIILRFQERLPMNTTAKPIV